MSFENLATIVGYMILAPLAGIMFINILIVLLAALITIKDEWTGRE